MKDLDLQSRKIAKSSFSSNISKSFDILEENFSLGSPKASVCNFQKKWNLRGENLGPISYSEDSGPKFENTNFSDFNDNDFLHKINLNPKWKLLPSNIFEETRENSVSNVFNRDSLLKIFKEHFLQKNNKMKKQKNYQIHSNFSMTFQNISLVDLQENFNLESNYNIDLQSEDSSIEKKKVVHSPKTKIKICKKNDLNSSLKNVLMDSITKTKSRFLKKRDFDSFERAILEKGLNKKNENFCFEKKKEKEVCNDDLKIKDVIDSKKLAVGSKKVSKQIKFIFLKSRIEIINPLNENPTTIKNDDTNDPQKNQIVKNKDKKITLNKNFAIETKSIDQKNQKKTKDYALRGFDKNFSGLSFGKNSDKITKKRKLELIKVFKNIVKNFDYSDDSMNSVKNIMTYMRLFLRIDPEVFQQLSLEYKLILLVQFWFQYIDNQFFTQTFKSSFPRINIKNTKTLSRITKK